jgi:hypothetical protein
LKLFAFARLACFVTRRFGTSFFVLALTPALGPSTGNPVFLYGLSFDQLFLWRLLGSENGNSAEKQEAARLHQAEETRRYCRSVCRVRRGARVFRSQISEHYLTRAANSATGCRVGHGDRGKDMNIHDWSVQEAIEARVRQEGMLMWAHKPNPFEEADGVQPSSADEEFANA